MLRYSIICLHYCQLKFISILTNFFPTDLHGTAVTVSGYIHNFGAFIGSIAGLIFMFVLSIRLKASGLLQGGYRLLFLLAIVAPILFLAMLVIFEGMPVFVVGIFQRIYVGIMLLWLIITSNGIRSGAITPGAK